MGGAVALAARRRNVITEANSARRCSGKAESGSSNVGKTHDAVHSPTATLWGR